MYEKLNEDKVKAIISRLKRAVPIFVFLRSFNKYKVPPAESIQSAGPAEIESQGVFVEKRIVIGT